MPPPDNKVGDSTLTSEQLGLVKIWIDQGAQGTAGTIARVIPRHAIAGRGNAADSRAGRVAG